MNADRTTFRAEFWDPAAQAMVPRVLSVRPDCFYTLYDANLMAAPSTYPRPEDLSVGEVVFNQHRSCSHAGMALKLTSIRGKTVRCVQIRGSLAYDDVVEMICLGGVERSAPTTRLVWTPNPEQVVDDTPYVFHWKEDREQLVGKGGTMLVRGPYTICHRWK